MQTMSQKLITKQQWFLHTLYGQKYWDTPFFRTEKGIYKTVASKMEAILVFQNCISISVAAVWKSLKRLYLLAHFYWAIWYGTQFFQWTICRPVKFFHTDWIIISLWYLPYTQRHCHVRIEKGPVQTVAIKLEALNSLNINICLNIKIWTHGNYLVIS